MKPIKSLIAAGFVFVTLFVALMIAGPVANAQDSFRDVPAGNWAYGAITDFQNNDILLGYPIGFFSGKRILTRYEFALAIKRAMDNANLLPPFNLQPFNLQPFNVAADKSAGSGAVVVTPAISRIEIQNFKRLVEEFSKDLTLMQVNVVQCKLHLNALAGGPYTATGRLDSNIRTATSPQAAPRSDPLRSVFTGMIGGAERILPTSDSSTLSNEFNFTTRIGSSTTSLFVSSPYGSGRQFTGDFFNRSTAGIVGAPLAIAPPIPESTVFPLTQSGIIATRSAGVHVSVPVFNNGTIGGTLLDFSNPATLSQLSGDVIVGGLNFNLNPIGRVHVSGEASKSVAQLDPGGDSDSNAFNLNLRYDSGQFGLLGGFQYIDPGYEAPSIWNRIGVLSNLTNVQGPFVRVNYNLNTRTQFQVGSDLLAGARNRSYNFGGGLTTGFGTHDFISTLSAGMQYKLWHSTSLTADWEGVYWDLSAASSGLGVEAHPFESYINLGTGINLRGNAMLKMGYQIGSFGNFTGFGGLGPSGSGQTYNAFTTELNVKF